MADEIVLPVPETLSAVYVVPTSRPPDDLDALTTRIVDALGEPLGGLVRGMLTVPLLELAVRPTAELPPMPDEILAVMGASDSSRALAREASHAVVVTGVYQPGWPPAHEWGAAAVAGGIAARLDVPVLDVVVPRLRTAKQVLDALPTGERPLAAVDWIQIVHSATPEGLWFTTKGLGRFGLPELATEGVPPQLAGPWTSVLNGLAQVLLRTYADTLEGGEGRDGEERPAFVTLPAEVGIGEEDVVRAHGGKPAGTRTTRLRLRLDPATDPDADSFLTVVPPLDFAASAGEFMVAVCADLFGAGDDEVVHAPDDEAMGAAMDAAIDRARATLAGARQRFVDGGIPAGSHLIVKHGLESEDGTEFVWAYVTDWQTPDRVVGRCGSDADSDPEYRVGRPVRLLAEDVVDWAVWTDGTGIVEGGFTDAVLSGGG
ncbi:DUF2314 domain-containing protein [Kineosporia sp. R_H_3]|uniref:DUF2314 domain-containing protein n=1 Tax=Kineosporia sp. R_H_3 TaxID=1961848 RepID=UPI000B4BD027|nr:DUF2314 domain-containing protein [Kineosporia sp. R_H_3]